MADGNNPPAGASAHLFAPISAPRITSISRRAIQDFLADREAYEDAISAQPGLMAVSWRSCFPASFLRSLVRARIFRKNISDVTDLTDELIKEKLTTFAAGTKTVSADEALADVKRNVRLDATEPDARMRIMMLSASYLELCDKRGWNFIDTAPKAAVKHIVSVLQPPKLKQRIEDALELEQSALEDKYFDFIEFLTEKAIVFEEVFPLREYRSSQRSQPSNKGKGKDQPKSGNSQASSSSSTPKESPRPLPFCLNKAKCKKRHLVKDCPDSTAEEAKTFLEAYRAEKKNKGQAAKVSALLNTQKETPLQSANQTSLPAAAAVLDAKVDNHTFVCRIDSGADVVAISETIVNYLGDQGVFLPTLRTTQKEKLQAADGRQFHSLGVVEISPVLQTVAGPCRLRNVKAHIMPDEDTYIKPGAACSGEIFLGNPFLIRSGLDVKDFVATNISRLSAIDYGALHNEPMSTEVGKLGCKLLSNQVADTNGLLTHGPRVCSMLANGDFPLKDADDIDYKDVEVGEQDELELNEAIKDMVDRASKNLPVNLRPQLEALVTEFTDIFRTRLGNDPPVSVPPMIIEIEGDERPIKVRQRTYSPEQLSFLKRKVQELVKVGYIYRNNASKWACAPLIVPKEGKEGYRFTVDLRPINAQTKKNVWPMPHADQMLAKLTGSKVWFNLDFIHGYWQFPLSEKSQECQSFHTPFGVYTPKRVLHGAKNSGSYFQSAMESMFGHLEILIYIDDLLGYANAPEELLKKLRSVFTVCREKGLKMSPNKCKLVTYEVQFCGRIINKNGIKFHPRQYEALTNMPPPATVSALMEMVHGANWMRTAIPNFSTLVAPLHELLEENYTLNKTRKKSRLLNRPISAWGDEHQAAFTSLIQAIKEQVTLATPDPTKRLCLFTDASSTHWSGVLTQVSRSELNSGKEPQLWSHSPVPFVSGSFRGSSSRWTTPEKESYAIVTSVIRLAHVLVACEEFSLFTDHKNILYMLSPTRFNENVARHIVHKVQPWALRLSEFNFTIEHIPGEHNIWADILTRWGAPDNTCFLSRRVSALSVPLITSYAETQELPSIMAIAASQHASPPTPDSIAKYGYEYTYNSLSVWRSSEGKLYVPQDDEEMHLRICVAAHCGLGGHRGYIATRDIIKEKLHWPTLDADVKSFVQSCLVCLLSASGDKVPRPLGHQIHAERVSELLHFDFLYIGESTIGHEYILILKDDFSGYVFLRSCESANAQTTADVLMEYFSTFVPVLKWFSDQGSHFKNEVMEILATSLGAKHRFSSAYVPWSNGTVESVCKEVLRVMRALSSEFRIPESDWTKSVLAIQSIINNSPSRRLGNRAPITVHTAWNRATLCRLPLRWRQRSTLNLWIKPR